MTSVFINLTNHPSATWGADQLAAAELLGRVVDILFPIVSPDATTDEIHQQADKLVGTVLQMAENMDAITVHVMGEHTLTYALVVRLKEKGIKCVASTSHRGDPIILPNGDKLSRFKFVQFREY